LETLMKLTLKSCKLRGYYMRILVFFYFYSALEENTIQKSMYQFIYLFIYCFFCFPYT